MHTRHSFDHDCSVNSTWKLVVFFFSSQTFAACRFRKERRTICPKGGRARIFDSIRLQVEFVSVNSTSWPEFKQIRSTTSVPISVRSQTVCCLLQSSIDSRGKNGVASTVTDARNGLFTDTKTIRSAVLVTFPYYYYRIVGKPISPPLSEEAVWTPRLKEHQISKVS